MTRNLREVAPRRVYHPAAGERAQGQGARRLDALLLPKGRRRATLERWFDEGVQRLNCVPFEAETGLRWAELLARLRTSGRAMPIKDSLIAATALVHGLTVVTRNRADFEKAGVKIVDPFVA